MKQVPIQFDTDFEGDRVLPINLGRLFIGSHAGRLMFCPDGLVRMYISEAAIKDGSLVLYKEPSGTEIFGFGKAK